MALPLACSSVQCAMVAMLTSGEMVDPSPYMGREDFASRTWQSELKGAEMGISAP